MRDTLAATLCTAEVAERVLAFYRSVHATVFAPGDEIVGDVVAEVIQGEVHRMPFEKCGLNDFG